MQEFDMQIVDKKGSENQVVCHLSRLSIDPQCEKEPQIKESFLDERLFFVEYKRLP